MDKIIEFLNFELINIGAYQIRVYSLVSILVIFFSTKLVLWLMQKAIYRATHVRNFDKGSTYALFQIVRYVIWIISIGFILESIGIEVTVLIAGSAALLVGVGLGLQQTFNDILSGIILLSEQSIKIDDVLEIDGDVVQIQSIGLRTSTGLNRDDISVIIPNSSITTSKVINWSHQTKETRFRIEVGVAYGSDIDLVIRLLEESASEHPDVSEKSRTEARLMSFGNSSLDLEVLFFSTKIFRINKVKSDIRRSINRKFAANSVSIPFPQMDLHLKSNDTLTNTQNK
tara:strand:- start:29243 stop:30100 length:858 start_codon:yes stop_codon:yes gene_type:complete